MVKAKRDDGELPAAVPADQTFVVDAETLLPVEPVPAPVVDVPNCTVRTFCSGSLHDPITKAFISCEERVHGTRKLTDAQWAQLIQDFKSAAR